MPRTPSQHALARRAYVPAAAPVGWVERSVAAFGISVLGLGLAGSAVMASSAQNTAATGSPPEASIAPAPATAVAGQHDSANPSAFDRRSASLSRAVARPDLTATGREVTSTTQQTSQAKAVEVRTRGLTTIAQATEKRDAALRKARATRVKAEKAARAENREKKAAQAEKKAARAEKAEQAARAKKAAAQGVSRAKAAKAASQATKARAARGDDTRNDSGSGSASLPITSRYHIAARFGDTGSWSRYHTGIDFATRMGTPIHAVAAGTVTHAGSGSAHWAGHYVTIRHSDGKTSLYAHMSTVSVHQGERVSGGEKVGAVGMTGRTFGPHVHFEIYPAHARVGSPYQAVNPGPWLRARGLHF